MSMVTQDINKSKEDCLRDLDNCRESIFSPGDFYCMDVTLLGAILWIFIFVFPVLLFNLLVLCGTFRNKLLPTLSRFPPLVFSGNFSLFLFGPTDPLCSILNVCVERKKKQLVISPLLTWTNIVFSMIQATLALLLLNKMKGVEERVVSRRICTSKRVVRWRRCCSQGERQTEQ